MFDGEGVVQVVVDRPAVQQVRPPPSSIVEGSRGCTKRLPAGRGLVQTRQLVEPIIRPHGDIDRSRVKVEDRHGRMNGIIDRRRILCDQVLAWELLLGFDDGIGDLVLPLER